MMAGCVMPLICSACAGWGGGVETIEPGQRPAIASDEAGLWMMMDRFEQTLAQSAYVVGDPVADRYLKEILCKLSPEHCGNIRIYLVRKAGFNASMAPNGAMLVWTGTLLRCQNEAQLATILAHELAHYLRRHTLRQWRDMRAKAAFLSVFQLAVSAFGAAPAGSLASLGLSMSVLAYSREHEEEADEVGFELAAAAGYAPSEAPKIWGGLLEEQAAAGESEPWSFFSSHPSSEERLEKLRARVARAGGNGDFVGEEEYLRITAPLRGELLRQELRQKSFARTQVLLDRLRTEGVNAGELHYFQGELYRLRNGEGDAEKAVKAYLQAMSEEGAPAERDRELGLIYRHRGEADAARAAFARYLDNKPEAPDQAMIRWYLENIGEEP